MAHTASATYDCEALPMSLRIGDTIGDYKIVERLGRGGTGQVFRVEHGITRRLEALKILRLHTREGTEPASSFLREIEIHASLNHPNIVAIHNAFLVGNDIALVMELVEGESLRQMMERGRVPIALALRCLAQVLCGLSYAHRRGIAHGGISPSNIIVTSGGRAKLMDFGLSRENADLDVRGDLDSLATVLYEVITGQRPLQNPPASPENINPEISAQLSDIATKALSNKPIERYQSADEFREALDSALETIEGAPAITPVPGNHRRRLQFAFAVTGLLSALLVLRAVVLDAPAVDLPSVVKWPAAPVLSQPVQVQAPDEESPAVEPERPKLRMARHKTRAVQPSPPPQSRPLLMAAFRPEPEPARAEPDPAPIVERREPVVEPRVQAEPAARDDEPASTKPKGLHRFWSKVSRVFHTHRKSSEAALVESGPDSSR